MHPFHAVNTVYPVAKADQGRQKPRRRAGVANENPQRGLQCSAAGNFASPAPDNDRAVAKLLGIFSNLYFKTQRAQPLDHHLGVLAPQGAAQGRLALGQRREDQRAIGDALGAGHRDPGLHGFLQRDDFDEVRQRHGLKFQAPRSNFQINANLEIPSPRSVTPAVQES